MKYFYKIATILIVLTITNFAQDLKSLLVEVSNQAQIDQDINQIQEDHKCGFSTRARLNQLVNYMTPAQLSLYKQTIDRPELHKSIVTPKGYFRIHFDTTGIHKPGYDVNELAIYCDEVYEKEIDEFGFNKPPSDNEFGGDDKYDIYIQNINFYGETVFPTVSSPAYNIVSYIKIDNDFNEASFYTSGMDAAKVTVAHEFNHAIQLGYVWQSKDVFYYEMTSTAIEELVFDDVNDYYQYLPKLFDRSYHSITNTTNEFHYANCIFNLFLVSKFDVSLLEKSWEKMKTDRALGALKSALEEKNENIKDIYEEFSNWLYFTGSRAQDGKYFEEAKNYPELKPINSFVIKDESYSNGMIYNTYPVSNNFITYIDSTTSPANEITIRITNSDYSSAIVNGDRIQVDFTFTKGDQFGEKIAKDYSGKTDIPNGANYIGVEYFVNGKFASETIDPIDNESNEFVFPQPYKSSKHSNIYFTAEKNDHNTATLYIYSLTMELLYSSELSLIENRNYPIVRWNGIDNSGKKLSSGVYIYVVDSNDKLTKGKFAVLND